ncbi:MAG: DUF1501 domain-containing protein [Acidobacteria bacterium]|nr:DUF1501 domain-containing protein [Acidobacteriota bacterium]
MPSRRHFLQLAAAALHAEYAAAETSRAIAPLAERKPHQTPRAKAMIFLFMDGGVSHVDSFDPKPRLQRETGQPLPLARPKLVRADSSILLGSPFSFRKYGACGADVSELFPHVGARADDLCIVRSMAADHSEHTAANYFMHSGSGLQGRPSMGSWVTFGLGSPSRNLPGYVVLDNSMIPPGGLDIFGSGFLPASYQGSLFRNAPQPVADLAPSETPERQRAKMDLRRQLDRGALTRFGQASQMEAAVANYELAFRMQSAVPELADISGETAATRRLYGLDDPQTEEFGRSCLLARRLIERGVRFVELLSPKRDGFDRWDQHANLKTGHATNARATDKPIAGLLADLKTRGLLDSTLVLWSGEFGRTPTAQGSGDAIGRDHHPYAFTCWLAGGGVKGGLTYGATDEYGFYVAENRVHVHDLHATVLHLLGLDHKQLTYPFSGRQVRLTDVHGEIVRPLLA